MTTRRTRATWLRISTAICRSEVTVIEIRNDRRRLSVWIPSKVYAEAQYRANMSGMTLTEYVIKALEEGNEKEGRHEKE